MIKKNILFLSYTLDKIGGINSYASGLINELSIYDDLFNIFIISTSKDAKFYFHNKVNVIKFPYKNVSFLNKLYWENFKLPKIIKKEKIHIIHGTDYSIPIVKTKAIKISTFHDAILFTKYDGRNIFVKLILKTVFKLYFKSADYILTVSEFSLYDLQKKIKIKDFI